MITTTPPIGILIDLPFGLLMWASFVHFLLNIVMNEDSAFVLMRLLRGLNAPIYAVINLIKPAFIHQSSYAALRCGHIVYPSLLCFATGGGI